MGENIYDKISDIKSMTKNLGDICLSNIRMNILSVFSKSVYGKYGKFFNYISSLGQYYRILRVEKEIVIIQILGSNKNPLYDWELYQRFDKEIPYDLREVKITCTWYDGDYHDSVVRIFHQSANQLNMFNAMMHDINQMKLKRYK